MAVDNQTVEQIAFLSRLKIDENKLEETKDEFNKILNWVAELQEVNTDNVEQLVSVNEENLFCREDVVKDGNIKNEVLKNVPLSEFGYFAVPKVVE
ncbi:MAG: Asp-tRNA(Asn)/Glu-tRNA(Gln) amidotransferase subunit GatC [Alphaproteobacteria bacterium]|nr:Asp-tRNA(Asn)/Glu-tRNA(Gln) amidotransferase subunit GatC [Alphaproteobacteria bacterium]